MVLNILELKFNSGMSTSSFILTVPAVWNVKSTFVSDWILMTAGCTISNWYYDNYRKHLCANRPEATEISNRHFRASWSVWAGEELLFRYGQSSMTGFPRWKALFALFPVFPTISARSRLITDCAIDYVWLLLQWYAQNLYDENISIQVVMSITHRRRWQKWPVCLMPDMENTHVF